MGRKAAFKRKTTHPFERELPDQRPAIQTEFRNSGIKGTKCIGLNGKGSSTRQNSTPTRGQLNSDKGSTQLRQGRFNSDKGRFNSDKGRFNSDKTQFSHDNAIFPPTCRKILNCYELPRVSRYV